eukprot:5348096-Heterocapsa_arctica.AAC.2
MACAEISCRIRFGQGTDRSVKQVVGHRWKCVRHVPCTQQPTEAKSRKMPQNSTNNRTRLLPATTGNESHRARVPGLRKRLPEATNQFLSKGIEKMEQSIALATLTP